MVALGLLVVSSFLASLTITFVSSEDSETAIVVDNCKDLDDGSYFMQLIEDSDDRQYPIVKIKCSNGYAILDTNYDSNLIQYFTSWNMWHTNIAGPSNTDTVNWNNWFIKSQTDTTNKFILSPNCNTCEETHLRQHFSTQTTYWMSGNLFGCHWNILEQSNCDFNEETYACYDCSKADNNNNNIIEINEESDPSAYYSTGQCATAIKSSDSQVATTNDMCELGFNSNNKEISGDGDLYSQVFKPSLGTDGRHCVCAQSEVTNYIVVDANKLTQAQKEYNSKYGENSENGKVDDIVDDAQSDGGAPASVVKSWKESAHDQWFGVLFVSVAIIVAGLLLLLAKWKCNGTDDRLRSVYIDSSWAKNGDYGSVLT